MVRERNLGDKMTDLAKERDRLLKEIEDNLNNNCAWYLRYPKTRLTTFERNISGRMFMEGYELASKDIYKLLMGKDFEETNVKQ